MKTVLKYRFGISIFFTLFLTTIVNCQNPGMIISEIYINPAGADSCKEYTELLVTKNIDFSLTPYTVIVCNNGTPNSSGWMAGAGLTYAFAITSGTVSVGDVVYVGGACMAPAGVKIRAINVSTTGGDGGIGNANNSGVFGNGGANADGVAIFNAALATITSTTVPVDAIFYGTGIGSAGINSTTGYQLPINDLYSGGKLLSSSFVTSDPGPDIITAIGVYNTLTNTWATPRTFSITPSTSLTSTSSVSLSTSPAPPAVLKVYLVSQNKINVIFNKKVQNPSATTISNYTLNPSPAISSGSLLVNNDTVSLMTASNLGVGNYSLTINGIKEQTGVATMTVAQTFTFYNSGITMKKYTWKTPNLLGNYKGVNIYNGGFSGLQAIKGYTDEIIAITDRGPNADANNNSYAIAMGGSNNTAKLFPLPAFVPNYMRLKLQGDSIILLSTTNLKNPTGNNASGFPNFPGYGGTNEIALLDTNGTLGSPDAWGIDCEGINEGNDNKDKWICEEYGVSIWHTDSTGKAIERFAPYGFKPGKQPEDIGIDTVFNTRNPNKGFEGIVFSPNKKVYGFIQNTLLLPASDVNLKKNTRLHRFIEIDTRTNTTRMLGYEHDFKPSTGPMSSIGHDKRYIGDAVAVNDHEFLILESGKSSTETYGKVYLIDINPVTAINPTNHFAYASNTKSFEQLLDSVTAASNGVTVVKKTLLIDLIAAGFDPATEKKEGLTILNDSTIAVTNDNDFGIASPNSDGLVSATGVKSDIYVFTLPSSKKLNICPAISISALSSTTICAGDSVKLISPTVSGITYQWKLNNVPVSGALSSQTYAKSPGAYELFATNSLGCVAISNTKTITVNPTPTISISTATTTICNGQSAILTVGGANTYTWSTSATTNSISITPSVTTNYSVVGTNTNNCSSAKNITINVSPSPTINAISSNSTVCSGQSATLTASGAFTYTWSTASNSTSIVVTPTTTTTYTVNGSLINNCTSSKNITINVGPSPTVSAISSTSVLCAGQSATLTASGAATYTWSTGSNSTSIVISPSVTTTYTLDGSLLNNCSSSSIITQSVSLCTGVNNLAYASGIRIYPNPANDKITIVSENKVPMSIEITNTLGELIYKATDIKELNTTIDVSQYQKGVYFVNSYLGGERVNTILIVQ